MITLLKYLVIFLVLGLPQGCEKSGSSTAGGGGWAFGAGGVIEHISVEPEDEGVTLQRLEEWTLDHGFKKSSKSWEQVTGQVNVKNNKGEVVAPIVFIREFSVGKGAYSLGVAASTEVHPYVTVFSNVEFDGPDEQVSDQAEAEFNLLEKDFHNFVETELRAPIEGA